MEQYDLIVAGGGLSGVAAAVAAAREGTRVLLIEKNANLGGAASNCLINPFMKYSLKKKDADGSPYPDTGADKLLLIPQSGDITAMDGGEGEAEAEQTPAPEQAG